ncbi:MAG TPA: dTDP-4-dehydrorhamnose 3,5-epimerase [bacterium]|nr:dTDP-4-dehydrorhamnose 3,5-epimerase [bacterium]
MRLLQEPLAGLKLIQLEPRVDSRGFFVEEYHARRLADLGVDADFVQDNRSRSSQGVLRGLHAQLQKPQGKLMRVLAGEIYDVALDGRPGSPTFGQWRGFSLKDSGFQLLYVPPGFFHGFCVLSPSADVAYQCTDYYNPGDEVGVLWNDPELGITWPLASPLLSDKDRALPPFARVKAGLTGWK